jgi:hypothetical protein
MFPGLDAAAYKALRDDIAERGIQVPIDVCASTSEVLDGHQRLRACQELRLFCPRTLIRGLDDEGRREHRIKSNVLRRHLTAKQRRALIAQDLRYDPTRSNRWVAALWGVSDVTVGTIRRELEAGAQIEHVTRFRGRDRKTYSSITVETPGTESRVKRLLREIPDTSVLPGRASPRRVHEAAQQARRDRMADEGAGLATPADCHLEVCDFRRFDVPPASVDLCLLDPPYEGRWTGHYSDLADKVRTTLKPGGVAVIFSGVKSLPELLDAFRRRLRYVWTITIVLGQPHVFAQSTRFACGHRPVVVFSNGPYTPKATVKDCLIGSGTQKDAHDWQQSLPEVEYLVRAFSERGNTVADYVMGSGTTALACRRLGRLFVGCDHDPRAVAIAKARLASEGMTEAG